MAARWCAVVVLLLGLVWAGGCANLGAIRSFADKSKDITGYDKLVDYYVQAPKDLKRYEFMAPADISKKMDLQPQQEEALRYRHKIITDYMDVLGKLAADDAVPEAEMQNLVKAIDGNKLIKVVLPGEGAPASAYGSLAAAVTGAALEFWRQQRVRELIVGANPPLQRLIKAMSDLAKDQYIFSAQQVRLAVDTYYRQRLALSCAPKKYLSSRVRGAEKIDPQCLPHPCCMSGWEALQEWRTLRVDAEDNKLEQIAEYAKALDEVAQGHQSLYDNRDNLDEKAVLKKAAYYAAKLQAAKEKIDELQ